MPSLAEIKAQQASQVSQTERQPTTFTDKLKAAQRGGAELSTGFTKRGIETLQNIGKFTMGAATLGLAKEQVAKTGLSQGVLQRATPLEETGAFANDIAQFFIPGGSIVKIGKGAQLAVKTGLGARKGAGLVALGARAGTEALGFGAIGSAQKGEVDKPTSIVAGLIPVGGALLSRLAGGASRFLFGPKGQTGLQVRFADPQGVQAFLKTGQRKPGGATIQDIEKLYTSSVESVRRNIRENYRAALEALPKRLGSGGRMLQVGQKTTIRTGGKTIVLDINGVRSKAVDTVKKFGVQVDGTGKKLDFLESPFGRAEERKLLEVFRVIDDWRDTSPAGLNRLARKIGNMRVTSDAPGKRELNAVIDSIRNGTRDYMADVGVPGIKQLNASYSSGQNFLNKLEVNIEGKSKLNVDQTANKIFQLAKDLDDPFKREGAEQLLKQLERHTGVPVLDMMRALSAAANLTPQGSQGLRAGVVRELTRLLEVGVSAGVGAAGTASKAGVRFPSTAAKATLFAGSTNLQER